MLTVATIVLAAGCSSRLGRPKQLVSFGPNTLLRHAAETALAAALGPVIVVLGAEEERCREALSGMPVIIVTNADWQAGMGSSIATGMQEVRESEHRAVTIMLCDQPAITPGMLHSLEENQRATGKWIVASCHDGVTLGPPAIFTAAYFPQLRLLRGNQGAKSLFQGLSDVGSVPCPEAEFDIDTEEDVLLLENR
jgi:molybdenum cofactor cytidylyltransferase